ncbi:MAG: hypothetical protein H6502_02755 [Candidatus Woesearchaeota archaeon]|nr:MAG: hypothetical protein H6502_02755 [Candidatus Woesearchaeota archaeon]
MVKKKKMNTMTMLGSWSFLIGVLLAIILGLVREGSTMQPGMATLLVVLGILVGLFNVTEQEVQRYLFANVSLIIIASMSVSVVEASLPWFGNILEALMIMFVPSTIIVALKSVFELAKDE